jgi:serine/threonine-protein kinase RsbW
VQVSFHLSLPRDESSVPITRRLIAQSLDVVGVDADTVSDVEIALSEACANVLRHAKVGDEYEVLAGFDEERAFLEVIDRGEGFDPDEIAPPDGSDDGEAESGRGVTLMRALMDDVHFQRRRLQDGTPGSSVILEKRLRWRPGAPVENFIHPAATLGAKDGSAPLTGAS